MVLSCQFIDRHAFKVQILIFFFHSMFLDRQMFIFHWILNFGVLIPITSSRVLYMICKRYTDMSFIEKYRLWYAWFKHDQDSAWK